MLRIIKTQEKPKLMELSLKQREMLLAYRHDKAYMDGQVTWREFVQESREPLKRAPIHTPNITPRPSDL